MKSRRMRRALAEEIEAHLAERTDALMQAGMAEQEARQQARREFGNPTLYAEISRESWGWVRLERLGKDLRYAARALRAAPLFTLIAILSLTLGIGANTAIFTLLHASLWRQLPVAEPQQIFHLLRATSSGDFAGEFSYSHVLFQHLSQTARPFAEVFAKSGFGSRKFGLDSTSNEHVAGESVSANFFSALGVGPLLGRLFEPPDDNVLGGSRVAVLSQAFWKRRFQSDPAILGRTIYYDETPYTVVGVARPGFTGIEAEVAMDVWVPVTSSVEKGWLTEPDVNWLRLLARLRPAVSPTRAEAMFQAAFRTHVAGVLLPNASPRFKQILEAQHLTLRPAGAGLATTGRKYRKPLLVLLAVVALVLLVSCANVANLILARNYARQREIALRLALGASRARIAGQLLAESLLLSLAGAGGGLLVAAWGTRLLVSRMPPSPLPLAFQLQPDLAILGFTASVAIATATLFGLVPALRATSADIALTFRSGRGITQASVGGRLLVVGQLALSLLLLIGAGLFLKTLNNLQNTDLGFRPENVVTFDLSFPKGTSEGRLRQTYTRIKERLEAHPGVRIASYVWPCVYDRGGWSGGIDVEGHLPVPGEDNDVGLIAAGPGFFDAIGLGLLRGRHLNAQDQADKPPVAVINESLARYYFGASSPIGRHIQMRGEPNKSREIVGVVRDAKHYGVREKTWRMLYVPVWKLEGGSFYVRSQIDRGLLSGIIRAEVSAVDKIAQVERIRPFAMDVNAMISQERMTALLSAGFGILAVVLAAVGLYGVVAYGISRRTNEFGIRMALGAQPGDVQGLVLRQSFPLIAGGVAIGLTAAMALARALSAVMTDMLYGVKPADITTVAGAAFALIAVALLAAFLPARRAARIDPMRALRDE